MKDILLIALLLLGCGALLTAYELSSEPTQIEAKTNTAPCDVANLSGNELAILENAANQIRIVRKDTLETRLTIHLPANPKAFCITPNKEIVVVGGCPEGWIGAWSFDGKKIEHTWNFKAHSPEAIVESNGNFAVCDRYANAVVLLQKNDKAYTATKIPVTRMPVSAVFANNGQKLWVANAIPNGMSDTMKTTAVVSIIDCAQAKVTKNIPLPEVAFNLQKMAISPNGKYIVVPHNIGRTRVPVLRINRAWIVANMFSVFDAEKESYMDTIGLDDETLGAPNPTATAFSADGKQLAFTIAGNHEVILIDFPALCTKLEKAKIAMANPDNLSAISPFDDYLFIQGISKRIPLPLNGPRAITFDAQNKLYIPGYFSNNIVAFEANSPAKIAEKTYGLPLKELSLARRGEAFFNDAWKCNGRWFSCVTCHPNGRMDGVGWDLLNDGAGNPKNTRSMLYSIYTPPCMALGVRKNAEAAIRSGFHSIQFYTPTAEDEIELFPAVEAYFRSLKPIPSPYLVDGKFTPKAEAGRKVFEKASCIRCHAGEYMTDNGMYDVGTTSGNDAGLKINTPSLIELYLTGPYLHTGAAATVREAITTHNPKMRGNVKSLSEDEIDQLVEYLLSL